jgi:hypothetical protein
MKFAKAVIAVSAAVASLVWAGGGVAPAPKAAVPCHVQKVYVDTENHLMWQDEAYTIKEDGAYARGRTYGKVGSHAYAVRYCENLNYAGYNDWRLPTADEMSDMHRKAGQLFSYYRDGDFWTATPTTKGRYYVVFPADAYRYKRNPRRSYYIRCVRCMGEEE